MFVATYATMCFGMAGMDLNVSATIVSIMTLGSAIFSLFSGKVLGLFKAKGFLSFVLIIAALGNVAMIIFGASPSLLSIVLIERRLECTEDFYEKNRKTGHLLFCRIIYYFYWN